MKKTVVMKYHVTNDENIYIKSKHTSSVFVCCPSEITTVEGLVDSVINGLQMFQPQRRVCNTLILLLKMSAVFAKWYLLDQLQLVHPLE